MFLRRLRACQSSEDQGNSKGRFAVLLIFACPFLVVFAALVLLWPGINVDIGGDEGLLAAQTMRVLSGQLPNADFASAYMGGNIYFNTLWFLLFGESLYVQRVSLLFLACVYMATLYFLSRRLMTPGWASIAALFAFVMTLPLYPHLAANWNALFLSLLAFGTLLKSFDFRAVGQWRTSDWWLMVTGFLVALSITAKHTVGLYSGFAFFTVMILNLVQGYSTYNDNRVTGNKTSLNVTSSTVSDRVGKYLILSGFLSITSYFLAITHSHLMLSVILLFLAPILMIIFEVSSILLKVKNTFPYAEFGQQFLKFVIGCGAGIVLYLLPYLWVGKLGVFLGNMGNFSSHYLQHYFVDLANGIDPFAYILMAFFFISLWVLKKNLLFGLIVLSVFTVGFTLSTLTSYRHWEEGSLMLYNVLPICLMIGGFYTLHGHMSRLLQPPCEARDGSKGWLSMAFFIYGCFMFMNVYPAGNNVYFAFSLAPWFLWLIYLFSRYLKSTSKIAMIPVAVFLGYWLIFGLGCNYRIVNFYEQIPVDPQQRYHNFLSMPRGGLWLDDYQFNRIQTLQYFFQQYSKRIDDTYMLTMATPINYFLSNRVNPTPYDYYSLSVKSDGQDIIHGLEAHNVNYVIIEQNAKPASFQPLLSNYLQANFKPQYSLPPWWLVLVRQ